MTTDREALLARIAEMADYIDRTQIGDRTTGGGVAERGGRGCGSNGPRNFPGV